MSGEGESFRLAEGGKGEVVGSQHRGGRTEQLLGCEGRSRPWGGCTTVASSTGGELLPLPHCWVSSPLPPNSQVSYLSSAPWPGGILHSHIPLPHAGGPVNSRGDTAGGSPRDSVLPVPKPHTPVGSPGKKPQTRAVTWLWRCLGYRPSLCSWAIPEREGLRHL